ncbi:radical SAM protein [Acetobacteraceae bacterium]|nr:radical SAM protein [Acetobacteraceae bacterium]
MAEWASMLSKMKSYLSQKIWQTGENIVAVIPKALDVSVTDYCNAGCNFCGFNKHLKKGTKRHFLEAESFIASLPLLKENGFSFINFQGGEPLLHPDILQLVKEVTKAGMKADLITNGWKLPEMADSLIDAGLHCLFVSLDSDVIEKHEQNRQLKGLGKRLKQGISIILAAGIPVIASVTVSKLVNPLRLPPLLKAFGFSGVTFSYPRQKPFASSSLVYGEHSDLVSFSQETLDDFLEKMKALKKLFPMLNPIAGIEDIQRHIANKKEYFPCIGGFKYYYLDWNLNLWRCEAWHKPFGKLTDLKIIPEDRSHCTNCMLSCYRDPSVLMYAPLLAGDAMKAFALQHKIESLRFIFAWKFWISLGAGLQDSLLYWRIFRGHQRKNCKRV